MSLRNVACVLLLAAFQLLAGCAVKHASLLKPEAPIPSKKPPPLLTVAAVGDLMLGTAFPNNERLPPDDGNHMLASVTPILTDADIAFGNLEGVLLDHGEPVKRCRNPIRCYVFRSPSRYVQHFVNAGFDVLSLANNHARDFGEAGRTHSMQVLDAAGIRHSGRVGDIASWKVKGLRVALIAFAPFGGSHDMLDVGKAQALIAQLHNQHDIVLVSFHGGAEGLDAVHVAFAEEVYFNENRGNVVEFAHKVIDAGADLVLGHGPHVPRAIELYKGRLVAYSLGNFLTYQGISIQGAKGLAPILRVTLDHTGAFKQGQLLSFVQQRPNGLVPDPKMGAAKMIAELTRADFPHTRISITEQGRVQLKAPETRREADKQTVDR